MAATSKLQFMTVEQYLSAEERSSIKHEYVDGRVFAMSSVTKRHNIIAGNIYSILRPRVRSTRCRAYISAVKVKVEPTNSFYYPDVIVSYETDDSDSAFTICPLLIVEVLSPSTSSIDRREKVVAYRQIHSLIEYLIVSQRTQQLELHRKNMNGSWDVLEFGPGAELILMSIPVGPFLNISLDAIYEDVDDQGSLVREKSDEERHEDESQEDYLDNLDW